MADLNQNKTMITIKMISPLGLRKWMEALAIYGVALINNSPKEKTTARRLADRVGFIRKTHYG